MDAKQITELIARSMRPMQRIIAIVLAMGVAFPAGILEKSQESLASLSLISEANLHTSPQSPEQAIVHQAQAIELYSLQASLLPRLISLLLLTGEYETASLNTNKFDENASLDKDITRKEIKLLIAQGEFDAAIDQAKSLAQASSLETDLLSLASLYHRTGKLQEAQKIYDQLLSKQQPGSLVIVKSADFYASIGKAEKADAIIDLLSNDDIAASTATLLGSYYLRHGNLELSEHWLRIAINKQPYLVDAWKALVQNYLSNDDSIRAYEAAVEGLKVSPKSPELHSLFAVSVMKQDAPGVERAIEQLKEFAAPAENLLATLKLLKIIKQAGEESPLTSDHIEKAQELISDHGTFLPAWLLAITINEQAGEFSNAAEIARKASKRFPSSAEPSQRATNLLIKTQRWDVALWQAQEWRNRSLNDPAPADKAAAKILLELGRFAEAVDRMRPYAKEIIANRNKHPDHLSNWICMLMLDGRIDEAYIIIKPLLDTASWLGFWLAQIQIIDPVDAESALRLTEVNLPPDDEAMLKLATAWAGLASRTGESNMLLEAERITRNTSDTISAQLVKGRIAVAREDWLQAEEIYRKVIDQEQNNLTALYKLAFIICQTTNASSVAMEFVERALVLAPDKPEILGTYALVLMEFERFNDAQLALMHAHDKRPDDAGISLLLAETTLKIGQTEEAWQMLLDIERMLSIRPAIDPKLQNKADKLRQLINEAQESVEVLIGQ